jgi:regulator of nonsense transcripts 2
MDLQSNTTQPPHKVDEEKARQHKRAKLKDLNLKPVEQESSRLDSSLKRHTALIKRMRQSMGSDNRDQIIKEIDSLSLEKYVDEISGAVIEGIGRCKSEKDIWSAVEVISSVHRRFSKSFTPVLVSALSTALTAPPRATLAALAPEQRDKEDSARVTRQRPVLRVCSELALVGIIKDSPNRSGGEWIMKALKEMLSNDPSLSSLPLLSTFLKSYSRPYLGISPPSAKQIPQTSEPGTLSNAANNQEVDGSFPALSKEEDELVEQDIRDRFKRMCEGYFETVCKKLVIEHKRLQEQDHRNHEAYIRSGEIFEDRQQAYEKMTKGYEKLLASCQTLSELLYLPLPPLPTASHKSDSILIGANTGNPLGDGDEELLISGGKWEDEEERRFFEDVQDLKDFVPKSVLGIGEEVGDDSKEREEREKVERERIQEEVKKLEEELEGLKVNGERAMNGNVQSDTGPESSNHGKENEDDE